MPKTSQRVFKNGCSRTAFYMTRKAIARKLQNPRLLKIGFHTLRHWKATTLYHQIHDIVAVQNFLDHKSINNTTRYIQLAAAIYKEANDEFTVKAAKTLDEAKGLLEVGFEYVCEREGFSLFRKRKRMGAWKK